MKKTFAFLSALLMASSCVALSASAVAWQEVVVAVNDDPSKWVTKVGQFCYYVDSKKIAACNPSQESFEYGDIIELENILIGVDEPALSLPDGTLIDRSATTQSNYDYLHQNQTYSITKVGSIFDNPVTEQFTVMEKQWNSTLILTDEESSEYKYNIDYLHRDYYQPDCVDTNALHSGDVVSCITYGDVPMLVKEVISAAPPSGDTNGDGEMNILDVIAVNRTVLGKTVLTENQTYHADLNQDGIIDAVDSLTMLKMLVGLE